MHARVHVCETDTEGERMYIYTYFISLSRESRRARAHALVCERDTEKECLYTHNNSIWVHGSVGSHARARKCVYQFYLRIHGNSVSSHGRVRAHAHVQGARANVSSTSICAYIIILSRCTTGSGCTRACARVFERARKCV